MSLEITGNNSFENVPLLDVPASTLVEGLNRCDPLFRGLATVGLSAIHHGMREAPSAEDFSNEVDFGDLFDDSNKFIGNRIRMRITDGWYPEDEPAETFTAGVRITEAALVASSLFSTLRTTNADYVGQTGIRFVQRRLELPVPVGVAESVGGVLNTYPPKNIQAQVFTQQRPTAGHAPTELTFAAALWAPGELAMANSTKLRTSIDVEKRTVSAAVTSATREGDFIHVGRHGWFGDLGGYVQAVRTVLPALAR